MVDLSQLFVMRLRLMTCSPEQPITARNKDLLRAGDLGVAWKLP